MRPVPSMDKWFISRPLAPPSSKSAAAFLNNGSTENSNSIFFNLNCSKLAARVASADRAAFFFFGFLTPSSPSSSSSPSSPSCSSSAPLLFLLPLSAKPLNSLPVSVATLSTRLV
ncbi:hypothetical protein Tdes44962_MAKER08887 [Teratosphaeria destructans]|uniref:Uncharacterized protein n=1 Tax=Teratosphaeria destructans TaxID=418781 RepID=A0A9W7W443_9PEZI|nr:hypothetical protein Tdes44962_MAKER08887 [Teratosphaeria destructans]